MDDAPTTPESEWLARVSPWLLADDQHQECIRRAIEAGSLFVDAHCTCPKPTTCDKECCR
jgi:hypothetical protein